MTASCHQDSQDIPCKHREHIDQLVPMTLERIRVNNVTFDFGTPLFTGLSFVIPCGVSLIQGGESRGKTSLLRLLAGELRPDSGTVQIAGASPLEPAQIFWHDPRSEDWHKLTPRSWMDQLRARFTRFDAHEWHALAAHLQLTEHLDKAMYMLSTGSQRKVNWITGLASGADVLLMDEPFAAIDLASIQKLQALLADWHRQKNSAWVLADYQAPGNLALAAVVDLGD